MQLPVHSSLFSLRVAAAALLALAGGVTPSHAQSINNIFSGTNVPGATSVTATATVVLGDTQTATIGPGFATTVSLPLGVVDSLTATMNPASAPGTFSISNTGLAGIAGTFSTDKLFSTTNLSGGVEYQFQLTKTTSTAISLLNGLNVTIAAGGNQLVNTATGGSLLGALNVLTLFGSGNTATINFTTPANLTTTGPLEIAISGTTTVGLLGNSLVFSGASFQAVPEPGTYLLMSVGSLLLGGIVRRRRRALAWTDSRGNLRAVV